MVLAEYVQYNPDVTFDLTFDADGTEKCAVMKRDSHNFGGIYCILLHDVTANHCTRMFVWRKRLRSRWHRSPRV
jgi:hypothetical protein